MKKWIKKAQRITIPLLIAMSVIGLWQGTAHAMEDYSDEDYTETSRLLNNQENKSFELVDPLVVHKETLPFFPQDTWALIFINCLFPKSEPIPYDKNTQLDWKSIVSIGETCKALSLFLKNLKPFKIVSKMALWDLHLAIYINNQNTKTDSDIEEKDISDMKVIKIDLENLTCDIKTQQKILRAFFKQQKNLKISNDLKNEKWVLDYLDKDSEKRESDLRPLIKKILHYAKDNHQNCDHDSVFVELEYLAQSTGEAIPPYKCAWRREYRRIFKDKRVLVPLAVCAGFWICYWSIKAINWHNKHYPYNASQAAYDAMLNQTTKDIAPAYWGRVNSGVNYPGQPDCFTKCYLNGWRSMHISSHFTDGTRYATYEGTRCCGGQHTYLGNKSDWIHFVVDKCGVSFSFWFDQVMAIANGTKTNSEMNTCSLNPDGSSITCGNAFIKTWPRTAPYCSFGLCLHLTRGDAMCAKNQIIQAWKMTVGLYAGVGFGAPMLVLMFLLVGFCF